MRLLAFAILSNLITAPLQAQAQTSPRAQMQTSPQAQIQPLPQAQIQTLPQAQAFLRTHCAKCHDGKAAVGGFTLGRSEKLAVDEDKQAKIAAAIAKAKAAKAAADIAKLNEKTTNE